MVCDLFVLNEDQYFWNLAEENYFCSLQFLQSQRIF